MHTMHSQNCLVVPWLNFVKKILDDCELSYIWTSRSFVSDMRLKLTIKNILHDQFQQGWNDMINENSKAINYKLFKKDIFFRKVLQHS